MQQNEGMLSGWSQFWRIMEVQVVKREFWQHFLQCLICLKMEWNAVEWKYAELLVSFEE